MYLVRIVDLPCCAASIALVSQALSVGCYAATAPQHECQEAEQGTRIISIEQCPSLSKQLEEELSWKERHANQTIHDWL
jgi:hypothetical protein